jgi:Tol biopolymer transport system component
VRIIVTTRPFLAAVVVFSSLLAAGCGGTGATGDDIAFVSSRDGDYAIYVMAADGSGERRLTDERGDISTPAGVQFQTDPAWSPDGTRIAFASARDGSFDIYVMNADGTGTKRLTSTDDNDQGPTWSPDGSRIAFARSGDGGHVYVMNADGTGVRRLTDELAEEGEPAWSPDGRSIAYTRRASGTDLLEIWVADAAGGNRRQLTNIGDGAYGPAWSHDGALLALAANPGGARFGIFTVGADGSNIRRVVAGPEDAFEPAFSPDGQSLAYSSGGAIQVLDAAGEETVLTDPDDNDSSPAWKPAAGSGKGTG